MKALALLPIVIVLLIIVLIGGMSSSNNEMLITPTPIGAGGPLDEGKIPAQYVNLVKQAGAKCKEVTPASIAGQIRQESVWNPRASSGVANGIAQFTPATWATWGKDYNQDGKADVWDPADAIPSQGDFMCALVVIVKGYVSKGQAKGDILTLAWAAYNAGPGRVRQYGGVPPIPETQDYVIKVRRYMLMYQQGGGGGAPVGDGKFMNPLQGQPYRLSSGFGPRGAPCAGCSTTHKGQDMAIATGTPIRAACSGRVIVATAGLGGLGNGTAIDCGSGVTTIYGHQSRMATTTGKAVRMGDVIGYVGSTGHSSGPHLHFEIHTGAQATSSIAWYSGTPIDPIPFMKSHGAPL
ncbi:peptidoglycan DD-metalloendopeptidase family protein [Luteipulveratus mongoliensis]|uniref:peptidoglycan DD-metalloendopeptidase family protein n=1 Tax=Luteipulveratus mongoliensis TaxID=571913 RepID=UPI00069818EF|nr:peptidoglycan DD-metalloendopeptidase family protein [Luteipulveratus mongoliensis]